MWDQVLAQAKFTYNYSPNRSTRMNPFHIVYGMHMRGIYELINLGKQEVGSIDGEDCVATMHGAINELYKNNVSKNWKDVSTR